MMDTPKLAIAIGYIDDDLITGAINYLPDANRKISHHRRTLAAIAAAVILVFGIGSIIICNDTPPVSEIPSIGDTPAYFYYQGDYYIYSGEIVFSLPDGFELIHEIENTGDSFNSIDFTGNIDGYVYMSESNKELAYFQWKGWNEEIDGKAPYLVLIKSE